MWPFKKKTIRWVLVETLEATIKWGGTDNEDTIYYYLFESRTGKRKVESKNTNRHGNFSYSDSSVPWQHPFYLKQLYPWLKGEDYSNIPSYWDKASEKNEDYVKELYSRLLAG